MRKISVVALLIISFSLVSLASTLTVWFSWEGQNEFLSIVKEFEQTHPGIHVNVVYVPKMIQKLRITLASGGTFPDVALVRNDYLGILVEANKIHPLAVDTNDFGMNISKAFMVNGQEYAYPYYADVQVVYLNNSVLKKAKIVYPSFNWTLDDMEKTAQMIKKHGYVGILLNETASYFFNSFNAAFNDGKIPQQNGIPVVTGEGTLKAAELYNYLFNEKKIAVNYQKMALVNAFKTGKAGMMFMGSFLISDFVKSNVDFSILPYPYLNENQPIPPVLDPKGFVVFKESNEVKEFLDYVTSANMEEKFCSKNYKLPANSNAAGTLQEQNEFFKVMNISAKRAIVLPTSKVFKEGYVKAVETALSLYLSGKMELKTAFEKAQEYIEDHK
ncbi:ABC transporter substrate-binding protein [Mesoaciditoga lauensis]|uniref:ABC transporter substrate-binding protein n=1 Tax=Mesoaciditoga lauensis TaxID=1495039 RepID=UPI00056D62FC|nr:extracellular solute-binding protein [Mesoaciditoga lauensis]